MGATKRPARNAQGLARITHAVVVSGQHTHWIEGEESGESNGPGTDYFQPGGQNDQDANFGDEEVILFIFFPVSFDTTFVE